MVNNMPHKTIDAIVYPCPNLRYSLLVKGDQVGLSGDIGYAPEINIDPKSREIS